MYLFEVISISCFYHLNQQSPPFSATQSGMSEKSGSSPKYQNTTGGNETSNPQQPSSGHQEFTFPSMAEACSK